MGLSFLTPTSYVVQILHRILSWHILEIKDIHISESIGIIVNASRELHYPKIYIVL